MSRRLRKFLDIRPGEGGPLLFTSLYVGVAVGSFLLAKPVRQGLFLRDFSAAGLVYVYVAVPLVLSIVVPVYSLVEARVGQRIVQTGTLLFLALNVLAFWWGLTRHPARWMSAAFYIWVSCYSVIAPVQAWTFANAVFDTRQARRLFGLVATGASIGAILGGVLARTLVGVIGTANLLLVLAMLIGVAVVVVNAGWHVRRRERRRPSAQRAIKPGDTLKLVLTTPYLRRIALMVSLVAIVTLWTGFQFQSLAEARFAANADHLTRLFADFNSSMGVIALLIQLVVSGPALRKFGLASTILMFPVTLACGLVAVALTGSLWAVVLTNAFDQVLRFSVDRPTFELLYVPIRSDVKPRVKAAIDLTINRLADGIGGVLLGLATTGFSLVAFKIPGAGLGIRGVAVMSLLLVAAWIAVALALRRGYVGAIRDSISQHRLETERASVRTLDRAATDLLAARLNASDPGEILYALDVFRVQHLGLMHPAVRGLLHHPAPEVRLRAISVLDQAGDTSVIPDIDALLADPEPGVRAEALLYLAHHADVDPLARITALRDFPDYSIQAGLVAFLGRDSAWQNIEASRVILRQMIARKDADGVRGRIEAARLLSQFPGMFGEELQALLDDPDESVVRAALAACGHPTHAADIERVLPRLADKRYRDAAVQALTGMGPDIVPVLREVLEDSTEPAGVRAEVPNVLAATGGTAARDVLLDNLLEPDVGLRTHIIVGLNRLHSRHPEIEVDRQAIEMVLTAEIMGHYRSYQILGSLGASFESDDQVAKGIRHVIEHEQQRIFRLLDSLLPDTDMKSVYVALRSTNPTMRGNATELLDNVLSPPLRKLVVPLFDAQRSLEELVAEANERVGAPVETPEDAVRAMLASDDGWLRAVGVYMAGRLRLHALRDEVRRFASTPDPLLRETVRVALARLEAGPPSPAVPRPAARVEEFEHEPPPVGNYGVG